MKFPIVPGKHLINVNIRDRIAGSKSQSHTKDSHGIKKRPNSVIEFVTSCGIATIAHHYFDSSQSESRDGGPPPRREGPAIPHRFSRKVEWSSRRRVNRARVDGSSNGRAQKLDLSLSPSNKPSRRNYPRACERGARRKGPLIVRRAFIYA